MSNNRHFQPTARSVNIHRPPQRPESIDHLSKFGPSNWSFCHTPELYVNLGPNNIGVCAITLKPSYVVPRLRSSAAQRAVVLIAEHKVTHNDRLPTILHCYKSDCDAWSFDLFVGSKFDLPARRRSSVFVIELLHGMSIAHLDSFDE